MIDFLRAVQFSWYRVQYVGMPTVAITTCTEQSAARYSSALEDHADIRTLIPGRDLAPPGVLLDGVSGLLLAGNIDVGCGERLLGDGPASVPDDDRQQMELGLLTSALDRDIPVLALSRGMQLLHLAFGGRPLAEVPGHQVDPQDGGSVSVRHMVYLSPGSKLAAILGMGGFFRVNSRHSFGVKEAQKSPRLLASAYSLDDGIIEGLESPEHDWVVGLQCCPERADEVPSTFKNLFVAFAERAERHEIRAPRVVGSHE